MDVFDFFSGEYKILKKVGQGAMGAVFQAHSVHHDETVAIKVLSPHMTQDKEFIKRFLREMQTILGLGHQNIVKALDCGICLERDMYFAVMEFVEGETIQNKLDREETLPLETALEMISQTAEGLEHAREMDIIHRDIKPDNLLVTNEGQVKVSDFGLARAKDQVGQITNKGDILGTPYYLSPEASMGEEDIDIRGDIYSLGLTLYHMLAGRPPFTEGNSMQIILAHNLRPMPSITEFVPDLPDPVVDLVDKMTRKNRDERHTTPGDVVDHIEAILAG